MNLSSRVCSHCGETGNKFYASYPSKCAPCVVKANGKWQAANKEKTKEYRLRLMFSINQSQFDAILDSQDGRCAVCGCLEPDGQGSWHVDHDHSCCPGQKSCGACVRGLLCVRCNAGLGMFGDDVDKLLAAVAYLTKWGEDN